MNYMTIVRDTLVIIPTIATLLGILIKTLNNFFLDCIKNRYRNVPAKKSLFNTVIETVSCIAWGSSMITMFYRLIVLISNDSSEIIDNTILPKNIIQFIALAIALLFSYLIVCTGKIFINTELKLIETIEYKDKNVKSNKKYRLNDYFNKHIIGINISNIILAALFTGLCVISILFILISGKIMQSMGTSVTIILIGIVGLSVSIISNSMNPVLKMLKKPDLYYIITKSETIICRFFLEYLDYYLIVEKDSERYISRGEVKEIRKIY